MPPDSTAEAKAASDQRKDAPQPKQKRPSDPVVVAVAAGKFRRSPRSPNVTKQAHERPTSHGPQPPRAAFTVPEFCAAHRISVAKYYEIKKAGWGPVEMVVGRRRVIAVESAERWRRERETAAIDAA
jgi:hypothetical protein